MVTCTVLSVLLMGFVTWWSARREAEIERARAILLQDTYLKLFAMVRNLMEVVREAAVQSSDGWLPANTRELCSEQTAALLCTKLNMEAPAAVMPPRPWLDWFNEKADNARTQIENILTRHGPQLDGDLVALLTRFRDSYLISMPNALMALRDSDRRQQINRPPTFCPFGNVKDPTNELSQHQIAESLLRLEALYERLLASTDGAPIPMPPDFETLRMKLGHARLNDEAIRRWEAETSRANAEGSGDAKPKGRFVPVEPR